MNQAAQGDSMWRKAGGWLFEHAPRPVVSVLESFHAAADEVRHAKVKIERLVGQDPQTGHAVSVIAANRTPSMDYFVQRCVGRSPRIESLGSAAVWSLSDRLVKLHESVDLLLARVHRSASDRWFDATWLRVPEAVGCRIDVTDFQQLTGRARRSSMNNIRRVRRSGLTWSISFDVSDLDHFYHEMYVPFTRRRFAELGYVRAHYRLRRAFRKGGLMWIEHEGQRIAGAVYELNGDTLYWLSSGTLGGTDAYNDLGVLSALYVFGPEYAQQRKVRWFDLGGSRPCLTDGVLVHKKRWGGHLTPLHGNRHDIVMRWRTLDGAAGRFLADAPLIFRRPGQHEVFEGLAAMPAEAPADVADAAPLADRLTFPGLACLTVTAPAGWRGQPSTVEACTVPMIVTEPGPVDVLLAQPRPSAAAPSSNGD